MITIGCAGFPVPATRYFKEFLFVEVQDTHVTQPGTGTIRRWRREAPPGFNFALLAPRDIGTEGFREGKVTEMALKNMIDVGRELDAQIAVFGAPPELTPTWDADDASGLAGDAGATAARDPLASGTTTAPFGYYRLPGPAGHKSRYEDPAIERLGELAAACKNEHAIYVFTNVDMFADAKRLKRALKLA
jgi:uncharacterized protein YecE (DUF72 family)